MSKKQTGAEVLAKLELKERKSRLLEETETDPEKRAAARQSSRKLRKLIDHIRKAVNGEIEHADMLDGIAEHADKE